METPHNSLPTFENLSKRGIQVTNRCLMCDEEEETTIHQFLNCPCARSIRHGSILGLRTSELQCNSVEQWLSQCIISSKALKHNRMNYLQVLFITLWSIWNHRNMVLNQGQIPNPIEVILISQFLTCRYQEAFNQSQVQKTRSNPKQTKSIPYQSWQFSSRWQRMETKRLGDMVLLLKPLLWMGVLFSKVKPIMVGSLSTWQLRKHWWNQFSKPKI